MHLTIFGGTGGTGGHLLNAALDAGHTVTAAVRDPSKIAVSHERLRVVRADVLDRSSLDRAMDGATAVASAHGAVRREPTTVYSAGVANILDAMRGAGVRRFIMISAMPLAPRAEVSVLDRLVVYPLLYRLYGEVYADLRRMEQVLRGSEMDWTVLRPPRLTNGPATGQYRTAVNRHLKRGITISRADLAGAMLRLLDDPHALRATIDLAY